MVKVFAASGSEPLTAYYPASDLHLWSWFFMWLILLYCKWTWRPNLNTNLGFRPIHGPSVNLLLLGINPTTSSWICSRNIYALLSSTCNCSNYEVIHAYKRARCKHQSSVGRLMTFKWETLIVLNLERIIIIE